jgi:hypothetical protein
LEQKKKKEKKAEVEVEKIKKWTGFSCPRLGRMAIRVDAEFLTLLGSPYKLNAFLCSASTSTRLDGAGYAGDQTRFFLVCREKVVV